MATKKPSPELVVACQELIAGAPLGPAIRSRSDYALLDCGLALRAAGAADPARRAAELQLFARAPGTLGGTTMSADAAEAAIATNAAWLGAVLELCAPALTSNRKLHAALAAM